MLPCGSVRVPTRLRPSATTNTDPSKRRLSQWSRSQWRRTCVALCVPAHRADVRTLRRCVWVFFVLPVRTPSSSVQARSVRRSGSFFLFLSRKDVNYPDGSTRGLCSAPSNVRRIGRDHARNERFENMARVPAALFTRNPACCQHGWRSSPPPVRPTGAGSAASTAAPAPSPNMQALINTPGSLSRLNAALLGVADRSGRFRDLCVMANRMPEPN